MVNNEVIVMDSVRGHKAAMSIAAFCVEHGISRAMYCNWRRAREADVVVTS